MVTAVSESKTAYCCLIFFINCRLNIVWLLHVYIKRIKRSMLCVTGVYLKDIHNTFFSSSFAFECESFKHLLLSWSIWAWVLYDLALSTLLVSLSSYEGPSHSIAFQLLIWQHPVKFLMHLFFFFFECVYVFVLQASSLCIIFFSVCVCAPFVVVVFITV